MKIKELIINLGIIKDEFKSFISRVFKAHGEIAEIINFLIGIIYFSILLVFLIIFGPILTIIELISEMDRSAIFILFIVIASAIYYFNNETYAINKKYQCNFDIFFPNWEEETKKLEKKEIRINSEIPYKLYSDEELNDAKQDLAKEEYLPAKVVREAKEMLRKNEEFIVLWNQANKRSIEKIQKCKEYITKNNP